MSRQVETLRGIPPDQEVRRKKQMLGVHRVKRKEWRQSAAVDRKLESTENWAEGVKAERTQARGVSLKPGPEGRRPWRKRSASVAPKLLYARTTPGRQRTQRRHYSISKRPQKGVSLWKLRGVHVLYAVAARASPLGDLVREVLCTSFTIVKASGNFVRQRDLLPLPVPCSWAPFAEVFCGTLSMNGGIAAATGSDADGVSCTVWDVGPC